MTEISQERASPNLLPWGMALWILAVHPLGVGLSHLLAWSGMDAGPTPLALGGSTYLLATVFAAPSLVGFAFFARLLRRASFTRPSLRFALKTGTVVLLLTSLAAQVFASTWAAADAQGGVLFIFLPLYAGVLSAVVTVMVYGVARIRGP
ncbi:hypothetical protein [Myxococcus stipitatus]|uniref:hypothetical protein n=1 Tax=Myxococcus stipitatus TaxID=83455 RepID=UPI0030D08565